MTASPRSTHAHGGPGDDQPFHIATLVNHLARSRQPRQMVDASGALFEAILKTMTACLHGAVYEADPSQADTALARLGTAGDWAQHIRSVATDPTGSGCRRFIEDLRDWLSDPSPAAVLQEAQLVDQALSALTSSPSSTPARSRLDLVDAFVNLRNELAHSGLTPPPTLARVAESYRQAVLGLVAEWPGSGWSWALWADGWLWPLTARAGARKAWPTKWPQPSEGEVYFWSGRESPLRSGGLLLGQATPLGIYCLNRKVDDAGKTSYINYSTDQRRSRRLDPPKPKWMQDNISAPLARIIGRGSTVERVTVLLERERLVTLVGPSGIGKTAIAGEVASVMTSDRPTALTWCDCSQWPSSKDRWLREVPAALSRWLPTSPAFLVLDSIESALTPDLRGTICSSMLNLLKTNPTLRTLTTSTTPLEIAGERQVAIGGLASVPADRSVPLDDLTTYPALELLVDRIRDVKPEYRVTAEDAPSLVSICATLGGYPLALQLVGHPVARQGATSAATDLTALAGMSRERSRDSQGRHSSIAAALEYSLASYEDDDRALLGIIAAVHPLSWSLLHELARERGFGAEAVAAALHRLEVGRLIERHNHSIILLHSLVGLYLETHPHDGWTPQSTRIQALKLASTWFSMEERVQRHCTCQECSRIDSVFVYLAVFAPADLAGAAPTALLTLATAWVRHQVEGGTWAACGWSVDDEPVGLEVLDGILALTQGSSSEGRLEAEVQAAHWIADADAYDRPEGWIPRLCQLGDQLRLVGKAREAWDLLQASTVGLYETLADTANATGEYYELCDQGAGLFVRLIWWARRSSDTGAQLRACLRFLRWTLDLRNVVVDEHSRRRDLLKFMRISARARRLSVELSERLGQFEASLTAAIAAHHLGLSSADLLWRDAQSARDMIPASDRVGGTWDSLEAAFITLFMRRYVPRVGGLSAFGLVCLEHAAESVGRGLLGSAAEWIGYADACGPGKGDSAGFSSLRARVEAQVSDGLGPGATTIAIAAARQSPSDTVMRALGWWLPGDAG